MNKPLLLAKLVGPLVLVALVIGIGTLGVLYFKTVAEREESLQRVAITNANLINSVGIYNQRMAERSRRDDAFSATLEQIREAFGDLSSLGDSADLLIVREISPFVSILVHQENGTVPIDHPHTIGMDTEYGQPMVKALNGETGTMWVNDLEGNRLLVAYAPVPALNVAVIVELSRQSILAPFLHTAFIIGALGFAAIAGAAAFTFTQTMRVIRNANDARSDLSKSRAQSGEMKKVLEQALHASGEGVALFDADDRLIICNHTYLDMYKSHAYAIKPGATLEEMLRAGLACGAFPDAIGVEEIWLEDWLEQHQKPESKMEQQVGDRWLLVSESKTEDGGTVGVTTDITELKSKERSLRESEKRFRDFTLTASDWVWETDTQHRLKSVNMRRSSPGMFDPAALNGKRREDYTAEPTDTPKWHQHYENLEARLPFANFTYLVPLDDGSARTLSISGVPVYDDDGEFQGYRGTGRDITDLIESQERLRVAFENVTVGIIFADETGVIEGFNPEAHKIFGYDLDDVIGKNVSMLMPDPDRRQHHQYITNFLTTGEKQIIGKGREVKGLRKDGTIFPMNLGIAEMNVQGRRHFIASITDLTVEHALEQQLRRSQKMEAIGQLTGGVAHDFNNLLGIIVGNLDLAKLKLDPDSQVAKFVDKAMTAAERGATLTRRLLNFSRQAPEENLPININDVLVDLQDLIGRSITSQITVKLVLNNDLPSVRLNQGDFEDAIINLAVNARDAMPDGGQLTIETRLTQMTDPPTPVAQRVPEGTYVELDISDNGGGMPQDVVDQIFQPFFTTKEKSKGTGLGLAMVYGFIKRSGGFISVYSELGIGTTFRIYLPIANADGQWSGVTELTAQDEPNGGAETILIVDDEEEMADVATSILQEYGYTTICAHSGDEALEILQQRDDIKLLFTDIIMPGDLNGIELADRAVRMHPNLPVLTSSGFTAEVLQNRSKDKATYPLISKPYNTRELAAAVRNTLDHSPTS
ncbi:PAS domain S-box protein [Thalassospira sp. MA62]|nr:PAS domain S-box protein [Thalassospira sp. MA62]